MQTAKLLQSCILFLSSVQRCAVAALYLLWLDITYQEL